MLASTQAGAANTAFYFALPALALARGACSLFRKARENLLSISKVVRGPPEMEIIPRGRYNVRFLRRFGRERGSAIFFFLLSGSDFFSEHLTWPALRECSEGNLSGSSTLKRCLASRFVANPSLSRNPEKEEKANRTSTTKHHQAR